MPTTHAGDPGLTSRCPVRNCKVHGIEWKAGLSLSTPLGTYIEDHDTMHIPPDAIGQLEPFRGGDLVVLRPCGHTFRVLPEDIAAEVERLRAERVAEIERTRPATQAEILDAVRGANVEDAAQDEVLRVLGELFEGRRDK